MLHDVEITPLVPGTAHVALTLLIAETGAWQMIVDDFKTKRRKVTVQFKKFKVLNDGDEDPWGEGDEAEIWFRAYNGSEKVNEFKWGPGQISDVGAASEVFVNFSDVVIGPDDLNGVDPGVGLGVYALERDYFFWIPSTDEAEYQRSYRGSGPHDPTDPLGVLDGQAVQLPDRQGQGECQSGVLRHQLRSHGDTQGWRWQSQAQRQGTPCRGIPISCFHKKLNLR